MDHVERGPGGPRLETARLWLRPFAEDDWPAAHAWASDPEVTRYLTWGPNTEEATHCFIAKAIADARRRPRERYQFAAVSKAANEGAGFCGLHMFSPPDREALIEYSIARPYWGAGLGTEVAARIVRFGFERLGLHRIFATCDARNTASARVLAKVGMQCEGTLRQHQWQKGEWRDSLIYGILEHEWRP